MNNNERMRQLLNQLSEGFDQSNQNAITRNAVDLLGQKELAGHAIRPQRVITNGNTVDFVNEQYDVLTPLRGVEFTVKGRNKMGAANEFVGHISGRGYQEIEFEPGLRVSVMGLFCHAFCYPNNIGDHGHVKLFFNLSGPAVDPSTYHTLLKNNHSQHFFMLINSMLRHSRLKPIDDLVPYWGVDDGVVVLGTLNDALKIDLVSLDLGDQLMSYCENGLVK